MQGWRGSMAGWKGRLGQKLPPALLRATADRVLGGGSSRRFPSAAGPTVEAIRIQHRQRVEHVAELLGMDIQRVARHAETVTVVRSASEHGSGKFLDGLRAAGMTCSPRPPVGGTGMLGAWRCHDEIHTGGTVRSAPLGEALGAALWVLSPEAPMPPEDVLVPTFPIDVVYTWVNGSDPAWRDERIRARLGVVDGMPPTADDPARFTSHNELKFSLRSLDYYAPWVNHIYIVTAGQVPSWLATDNERISVVPHHAIFRNAGDLPTFNSHAIESQLHRIPGLSEHFLYMNDDVFLGRPVQPDLFFTAAGHSRFFLSDQPIPEVGGQDLPVAIAARNNRNVLMERFGRTATYKFKHAAHAQRKSTLELIAAECHTEVAKTASARFRSRTDLSIPSSLAHYYGLMTGNAVPGTLDYRYVDIAEPDAQLKLLRLMLRSQPEVFCLNEVAAPRNCSKDRALMLEHFLAHRFPVPSSYERLDAN